MLDTSYSVYDRNDGLLLSVSSDMCFNRLSNFYSADPGLNPHYIIYKVRCCEYEYVTKDIKKYLSFVKRDLNGVISIKETESIYHPIEVQVSTNLPLSAIMFTLASIRLIDEKCIKITYWEYLVSNGVSERLALLVCLFQQNGDNIPINFKNVINNFVGDHSPVQPHRLVLSDAIQFVMNSKSERLSTFKRNHPNLSHKWRKGDIIRTHKFIATEVKSHPVSRKSIASPVIRDQFLPKIISEFTDLSPGTTNLYLKSGSKKIITALKEFETKYCKKDR